MGNSHTEPQITSLARRLSRAKIEHSEAEDAWGIAKAKAYADSAPKQAQEILGTPRVPIKYIEELVKNDPVVIESHALVTKKRREVFELTDLLEEANERNRKTINNKDILFHRMREIYCEEFEATLHDVFLQVSTQLDQISENISTLVAEISKLTEFDREPWQKILLAASAQYIDANIYFNELRKLILSSQFDKEVNQYVKSEQQRAKELKDSAKIINEDAKTILRSI